MRWRAQVKAVVERGLASTGFPAVSRRSLRGSALILAYHNVVPEGVSIGGDRPLHLPRADFAAQLDLLQETHDVVPLDIVVDGQHAVAGRPCAVITFDDAYRGAVAVGIREIVDRALPATLFVAPAFVGGRFFWWDTVAEAGASGSTESFRTYALEECRGQDELVRRWAETVGYQTRALPDAAACASLEELRAASAQPRITLASHSWSHPNLPRLTPTDLEQELSRPLEWLRERFHHVLPILSYPYGLSSRTVERAAAASGYRAGVLVNGGWISREVRNPFALPRLNVPAGLSLNGFLLRTAGLIGR